MIFSFGLGYSARRAGNFGHGVTENQSILLGIVESKPSDPADPQIGEKDMATSAAIDGD